MFLIDSLDKEGNMSLFNELGLVKLELVMEICYKRCKWMRDNWWINEGWIWERYKNLKDKKSEITLKMRT